MPVCAKIYNKQNISSIVVVSVCIWWHPKNPTDPTRLKLCGMTHHCCPIRVKRHQHPGQKSPKCKGIIQGAIVCSVKRSASGERRGLPDDGHLASVGAGNALLQCDGLLAGTPHGGHIARKLWLQAELLLPHIVPARGEKPATEFNECLLDYECFHDLVASCSCCRPNLLVTCTGLVVSQQCTRLCP